jgi:adenylate cyclase
LRQTEETLALAHRSGDDLALGLARCAHGTALIYQEGPECEAGLALLNQVYEESLRNHFSYSMLGFIDLQRARMKARAGDLDGAISLLTKITTDYLFATGEGLWPWTTADLVKCLLRRGASGDLEAAQAALERSEAVSIDAVGWTLHHLRTRALLAQAKGDEDGYRELAHAYLSKATSLGYHGHIAAAEAMT